LSPDKTYRVESLCTCSVWCVWLEIFFFPGRVHCMQGPGRPYIVNAGSWETRYSECRVRGDQI
ncbi:unnamed protein product, partial [Staurois parvus]